VKIVVADGGDGEERYTAGYRQGVVDEERIGVLHYGGPVIGIGRWIGVVEIGWQIEGGIGDIYRVRLYDYC
jgi:hypothetical protein